ncbi:MAG: DALR domain-containing protein [Terracidiphilus sp.]
MQEAAKKARTEFKAALDDDLNTADALAPVFELVRAANTAIDQKEFFCRRPRRDFAGAEGLRRGVRCD